MRFFFDHDVPQDLAYPLRALGHEVTFLREVLPTDTADADVFSHAQAKGLILLTCNRDDFIPLSQRVPHAGIIVVVRRPSRALERAALVRLLDKAGESGIARKKGSVPIFSTRLPPRWLSR